MIAIDVTTFVICYGATGLLLGCSASLGFLQQPGAEFSMVLFVLIAMALAWPVFAFVAVYEASK